MPPRRPPPIPPQWRDTAFTVAQGRAAGLTRFALDHPDLGRPFRGVRTARNGGDELRARCVAALCSVAATGSGDAVLTHLTAARWWPVPLPTSLQGSTSLHGPTSLDDQAIDVAVRHPGRASRAKGVRGHVVHDTRAHVVWRQGLPVIDAGTLFCQLSAVLSLADLVAVGDALVLAPALRTWDDDRPWSTVAELEERVDRFRGRGKRRAVAALALVRPGAESRPETLLRLLLGEASLPDPEVNGVVLDGGGRFVARCDLVFRQWRVIVEYDGDQHRTDRTQFERDVHRLEELGALGWRVVRVLSRDLFVTPELTAMRVRQALRLGGWSPTPDRRDASAAL